MKYWHIFATDIEVGKTVELGTGDYKSKDEAEGNYKTINDNNDYKYSNPVFKCYSSVIKELRNLKTFCNTPKQRKLFNDLVKSLNENSDSLVTKSKLTK